MKTLNKYMRKLPGLKKGDTFILLSFYNISLHTKQEIKVRIKFEIDSSDFIYIYRRDIKIDYLSLLKYLFPSCKINDCQVSNKCGKIKGYPDFELIGKSEDKDKFFIEVKSKTDFLSESQLSFAYNYENSFVMFIKNIEKEIMPSDDVFTDANWLHNKQKENGN